MSKILIKRKIGVSGGACKMICYIDNQEICRIKEEESFVYKTEKSNCEFKCQLTMGNPLSDIYNIDFSNSNEAVIVAKQGLWNPKVEVKYENIGMNSIKSEITAVENVQNFNATKQVRGCLYLDEAKRQWAVPKGFWRNKVKEAHDYSEILNYEVVEDGNSISKGGVGRAIVGGLLFGGIGAIVGGVTGHKSKSTCNRLEVIINLNNINNPLEKITLISAETKKDSIVYKSAIQQAQEITALLEIICNGNIKNVEQSNIQQTSEADEILKYKKLLDQEIITKEEFEAKKKQLLNI